MPASKSSAHTRETSEGDRIAAAGDDGSRHVVVRELAETLLYAAEAWDSARLRGLLVVSQQVTIHKHFLQ